MRLRYALYTLLEVLVSLRLPREDARWLEELAEQNSVPLAALIRALLHALKLAVDQGEVAELELGSLVLKR